LLLAKDNEGLTAWQWAAINGNSEALAVLRNWAKEMGLNPNEILLA
jgi:ankyrin repeat protein